MHSRPVHTIALLAALLATGCAHHAAPTTTSSPAPAKEVDTAPHTARIVEVAPGVSLEVLDFGGTGEPIVLLAGLGNTAHVFDDLAPALIDHHHVIAITRRGFGSSSGPDTGYDVPTRVADDLAVLDKLGLPHAILVGHSLAGDELTELAATHADRVTALAYLDAAQDHAAAAEMLMKMPKEAQADPPPSALASRAAYVAWIGRLVGFELPVGEHLASLDVGPKGEIRGFRGRPDASELYMKGTAPQDFTRVHAPALVLIALPTGPQELLPGYRELDARGRTAVDAWWPAAAAFIETNRANVKAQLAGAHVVEYPHGNHYLFITQRAQVLAELRAFLPH